MPEINDYVNYGAQGICKVEDLRRERLSTAGPRDYYVLRPVHRQSECIYVPADNPALLRRMRPVLSQEEIDKAIRGIRGKDLPWISDRRQRTALFQEILSRRDEGELLLLAGCLHRRAGENGKGLSSGDEQVLRQAETIIEQEFSFALRIGVPQVGAYIRETLGMPPECSS